MHYFSFFFIFLSIISLNGQINNHEGKIKLEIKILNIKSEGDMYFAMYDNEKNFNGTDESPDLMLLAKKEKVFNKNHKMKIFVKQSKVAIKVYIDKNYNKKFDLNFFGLPKEQYGFSNDASGLFGPPSFKQASFDIKNDSLIIINMK